MERKQDTRSYYLNKRRHLPEEMRRAASLQIGRLVSSHPYFQQASIVCCYLPYKEEVDCIPLIELAWKLKKTVLVPRVKDEIHMDFYVLHCFQELERGHCGIQEPLDLEQNRRAVPDQEDVLMLLPGAVFDSHGNRMGYGKGYYDTYLQGYDQLKTMGLAFSIQCVPEIPVESHDISLDLIMTEEGIWNR